METGIDIFEADLDNADHQRAIIDMTAAYALDPMGNSGPLPDDVLARLIPGLKSLPTSLVFLAYAGDRPVGCATCCRGFSSFMGQPLINIHDLALLPDFRGRGIGPRLLQAVERKARELGCGKVTLEVQEQNGRARQTYEKAGFSQAMYGATGGSLFYTKVLL